MPRMVLKGSLAAISVPDVLSFLNLIRKTGTLTLHEDGALAERRLNWRDGEIVFASSTDPQASLGRYLVRRGWLTAEDKERTGRGVGNGRRHGEILVEQGLITETQLVTAIRRQVLEIIYGSFRITKGWFTFDESDLAHLHDIHLNTAVSTIIMEGVRRLDEWPRLAEAIPSHELVPRPLPRAEGWSPHDLSAWENEVLELVDGSATVSEILSGSPFDEFETLQALAALVYAGRVEIGEAEQD